MSNIKGPLKAKIKGKEFLSPGVFLLHLHQDDIAGRCKPGQFVHVRCGSLPHPLLRRPFSIYDAEPKEGRFSLLIKVVGLGTQVLSQVEEGDLLDVLGPLGNFFPYKEFRNPLLIAGGIGVAPIHFLAKFLDRPDILLGAKTKEELFGLESLKRRGNVKVFTEDGSCGEKGVVTSFISPSFGGRYEAIFACGPRGMLEEVARIGKEMGMPTFVSLEERMACGIGACYGCVVKTKEGYKRICKEGPVMKGEEVIF